ncbi:MAG: hypothetical protein HC894_00660 [Microcoleus sp. SM1_3_4]|nr:hypothetical protein [Microcoleus sp. SM1_3_4]
MTKTVKKPVIVCVDDEVTILTSLKSELRKAFGELYRVEIAEGGEECAGVTCRINGRRLRNSLIFPIILCRI